MESKSVLVEVFGCDIGNGFGYISLLESADLDPFEMFPTNSTYQLDRIGMPTSAYISPPDGQKIEVFDGMPACDRHVREADKFIHAVKTRLKEGKIPVPGISKPVSMDRVYASIVRNLVKLGNERRKNEIKEPIYNIAFAYPAKFTDDIALINRMKNSIESITIDGRKLKVIASLPEPAAVAIDYLYYMQNLAPNDIRINSDSFTALVYDLGHGTFDTAVVTAKSKGEPYTLHFSDGNPEVGGKDFDTILYNEILKQLNAKYGYEPRNPNEKETIRKTVVRLKHELSDNGTGTSVDDINLPDGQYAEIEISRELFEGKTRHLIFETRNLIAEMISRAKEDNIKIDAIVLSGGASQMPMVMKTLKPIAEDENIPILFHRLSEAVSYGTARYGYWAAKRIEDEKRLEAEEKLKEEKKPREQNNLKVKMKSKSWSADTPHTYQEHISNSILEKYTEYSYGVWVPDINNIAGRIELMISSKEKLPAESREITVISASERTIIEVYRTAKKYTNLGAECVGEYVQIIRMPFEMPSNMECRLKMFVQDDYNIKISCRAENGKTIVKSTSDMLGTLID